MAPAYLKKRRRTYYFQCGVPSDLVEHWRKKVIVESLKTRNEHEARIAALELFGQYQAAFERVRQTGEPIEVHPSGLDGRGFNWLTGKPGKADPKHGLALRFSQAAEEYLADLERDPAAKPSALTLEAHRAVHRLFRDYCHDMPLDSIDRATIREFLDSIACLDPKWGAYKGAKRLSVRQLVSRFGNTERKISNQTLNRYLSSLSLVFQHARRVGKLDKENPCTDQWRRKPRNTGWHPYTVEELQQLFDPLAKVPREERVKPKKHGPKSALYWLPLIALYSGMRLNELCQLTTDNVKQDHGIWYFQITDAGEGQSVKTRASKRRVPIHSTLIRAGLLDYAKALPPGSLWPGLTASGPGQRLSWRMTDKFSEYRRACGIDRQGVTFHSLRKNVATTLDNTGVSSHDIGALLGHSRDFTLNTYSGGKGLAAMQTIVEKIEYPALKLDHLVIVESVALAPVH